MIRTTITLPEELYEELRTAAFYQKKTISELIRNKLKRSAKKKTVRNLKDFGKGFFGALKYGPKDLSIRINDIYK